MKQNQGGQQSSGQQQGGQQGQGRPKSDQQKKDPDPRVGYPNGVASGHPQGIESDEETADRGTSRT